MNKHTIHRHSVVFLVLILAVSLQGACGDPNEKSTSPAVAPGQAVTAQISACTTCHRTVINDWLTSKHANLDPTSDLSSAGVPTLGLISTCTKNCHDPNGDSAYLTVAITGNVPRPVIGCEACHGPGSLHANNGGSGPISLLSDTAGSTLGSLSVSGQFVMCTNCHELLNSSGTGTVVATHDPASTVPPFGANVIITDTHFATPGNWSGPGGAATRSITGYAMNYSDERVCATCHNPHQSSSQNREWAQSAHADTNPLNLAAAQTGYFSGAWAHFNWSCDGSSLTSCATGTTNTDGPHTNRRACQRCHTTMGFIAYVDTLKSGNTQRAHDINAGLVSLVTFTTNFKPEMLTCSGCHMDTRGTIRNPGAVTAIYDYISNDKTYARISHTYPDLAGSNVCMTCHVGRVIGDTIKGLNDPALLSAGTISALDFGNASFVNSHYLSAGGQVFTVSGYEFGGRSYTNIAEYRHDKIGTPATRQLPPYVDTGSNGPCIGCHMSRPNKNGNHLFLPVSRSTTTIGQITGIASEVCFNCHGPSSTLILDLVEEQRRQFGASLEALQDQIELKLGYRFAPYSPYWYRTPYVDPKASCTDNQPVRNWQTNGAENAPTGTYDPYNSSSCTYKGSGDGIAGTGQNNMGAAFNFNLLEHDPGAFVHNRLYVKRLIYDSIDWVDDGMLNYSVGTTLDGLDPAASPYKAEAMAYVVPNGVLAIEAERP